MVALAILLVVLLTAFFSLGRASAPAPATARPSPQATPSPRVTVPGTTPAPATMQEPVTPVPTSPVTTRRISYDTRNYYLLPIRVIPSDMAMYGYSDVQWKYNSSVVFAYVEENHGGITESFTVPYPVWRMVSTLSATRTPEKARFRMILVDQETGQILEGTEIRYPGSVTKTVIARQDKPLYMVISAENVEDFVITLEAPASFAR